MEYALSQTLGVIIWFYSPHPDPRHHLRNVGHWSLEGQKKGCECVHLHSLPSLEKKTENTSSTQESSVPCSIYRMALFPADSSPTEKHMSSVSYLRRLISNTMCAGFPPGKLINSFLGCQWLLLSFSSLRHCDL